MCFYVGQKMLLASLPVSKVKDGEDQLRYLSDCQYMSDCQRNHSHSKIVLVNVNLQNAYATHSISIQKLTLCCR